MQKFRSARRFIFTDVGLFRLNWYVLAAIGAFVLLIIGRALFIHDSTFQSSVFDRSGLPVSAEGQTELVRLQVEENLAQTDSVYMVVDLSHRRLQLKQHGAVVWHAPLAPDSSDSAVLTEFVEKITGQSTIPARIIKRVHLFKSQPVVSDTALAIVSDVLNVAPGRLQRYMPERLAICWDDGLCLDIRTDVVGEPNSIPANLEESTRERIGEWLGGSILTIRLRGDQAMALWGICRPGMITLLKT